MLSLIRSTLRNWPTAACIALLSATPFVAARASTSAASFDLACDCSGSYCQDTGGSPYQRWCCRSSLTEPDDPGSADLNGCGCTLVTNC
jgi:hypothetical protein